MELKGKKTKFRMIVFIAAIGLLLLSGGNVSIASDSKETAVTPPYLDYSLPIQTRVNDLLSRLTIEEKMLLLSSGAGEIPRLGIKKYHYGSEALHGIMGPGNFTVFPQAIAIAATWDPDLVTSMTTAISDEAWGAINRDAEQFGYPGERFLSFWSPTINMARDPRWGRTAETYGEDPYLTSRIGTAFVKGIQGNDPKYIKAVSTPKHFAANNEEHNRFRCNARISEKTLREYYLPAYKVLFQEGGAQSVMAAYNAINGIPCNASHKLLTEILRDEWGFDGYVTTDCDAIIHMIDRHNYAKSNEDAAAKSINAGVDIECGGDELMKNYLTAALKDGLVSEATINLAVSRLLKVRFRLGMFDPPALIPYTRIPSSVIGSKKHVDIARQVSRESIVLLKNGNVSGKPFLPLDANKIKSIAVVGPNADSLQFGDYTGKPANPAVTTLNGIRNKVGDKVKINSVEWVTAPTVAEYAMAPASAYSVDNNGKTIKGLKAEYFTKDIAQDKPAITRFEKELNLNRSNIPSGLVGTSFTVRWTGKIKPAVNGAHYLSLNVIGEATVSINGKVIIEKKSIVKKKPVMKAGAALSSYMMDEQADRPKPAIYIFEKGKDYEIEVVFRAPKGEMLLRLDWVEPKGDIAKIREREINTIRNSDMVIAVMGLQRVNEHENIDRIEIDIPNDQTEYLKQIVQLNPKIAVVMINGSAVTINWIKDTLPAIVEAWYPGEQGGNAIADVLFGDYNPAGRLPLTFYNSIDDLPPFDDYEISHGRTYMYLDRKPLFPFGYGLSYTTFDYSNLKLSDNKAAKDGFFEVSLDVKNSGQKDGDEVVQLYVSSLGSIGDVPKKQLKGFKRISLKKGESRKVSFRISVSDLSFWNEKAGKFEVESGDYAIQLGASSADIRLKDEISVR